MTQLPGQLSLIGGEYTCPNCGEVEPVYKVKLVFTNRPDPHFPKYIPMIRVNCSKCKRYLKFASQKPDLMNKINEKLEEIEL